MKLSQAVKDKEDQIQSVYPHIKPFGILMTGLSILGLFIILIVSHEVLRRMDKMLALLLMGVGPFVLWIYWRKLAKKCGWTWFLIIKTYSVTLYCCIFILFRDVAPSFQNIAGIIIYVVMVINICEAALKDYQVGSKLNAAAGFLMAISTPLWFGFYTASGSTIDVLYKASYAWIIIYTVWDFVFVYSVSSRVYGHHIAVLAAPLALCLYFGPELYFQARVFTLGVFIIMYDTAFPWFFLRFSMHKWHSERLMNILPKISFALAISYVCYLGFNILVT